MLTDGVPDGGRSHAERMIAEAAESVSEMKKMLLGNGSDEGIFTRLSHLERTDREMRVRLDKIEEKLRSVRNSVDVIAHPGEDPGIVKARLRLFGEIAVAVAAVLSLALQLIGG